MGNPPRPPNFEIILERLRLADAGERMAQGVTDEFVYTLQGIRIILLPIEVVLPPVG